MGKFKAGDKAIVTGDSADWSHEFDGWQVVTLLEPGDNYDYDGHDGNPRGWLCEHPDRNETWYVHADDLEPAEGPASQPAEVVRVVSDSGGAKDSKLQRYDMIPTYPLRLLAERYGLGAQKYAPVNGLDNYRNGYDWSLSYAAMQRHANSFWAGENIDPDSGQPHLAAVAWHAMTLLEWSRHPELVEKYDDRQDSRSPA